MCLLTFDASPIFQGIEVSQNSPTVAFWEYKVQSQQLIRCCTSVGVEPAPSKWYETSEKSGKIIYFWILRLKIHLTTPKVRAQLRQRYNTELTAVIALYILRTRQWESSGTLQYLERSVKHRKSTHGRLEQFYRRFQCDKEPYAWWEHQI